MRILSKVLTAVAVLLSDIMCAVVAYTYCDLKWVSQYAMYSASESIAFVLIIPYAIGIAVCLGLAYVFHKKAKKDSKN